MLEEMSLKAAAKDGQRFCSRDVLWQIVPDLFQRIRGFAFMRYINPRLTFQIRDAATGKARSPTVDSRVRRTISDGDDAERRQRRPTISAGRRSSSARYGGADPCWHL